MSSPTHRPDAYSAAADRNKDPILRQLKNLLRNKETVLEIGSGTGQHAEHFARALPAVHWICSDLEVNHAGIKSWIDFAGLSNISGPLLIDVEGEWPSVNADCVYTANTAHIMSWAAVRAMVGGASELLGQNGRLIVYGPFNKDGQYTSEGNAMFDKQLRAQNPAMGIRDDRDMIQLATENGFELSGDTNLPANNRLLVWHRT
ncbi:MAG: DUF938 domain-containing protein [Pseudomonadota bacterium]